MKNWNLCNFAEKVVAIIRKTSEYMKLDLDVKPRGPNFVFK